MTPRAPDLYELSALIQRQAELFEKLADKTLHGDKSSGNQSQAIGALLSSVGLLLSENALLAQLMIDSDAFDKNARATLSAMRDKDREIAISVSTLTDHWLHPTAS
jgi:hypothetical protein